MNNDKRNQDPAQARTQRPRTAHARRGLPFRLPRPGRTSAPWVDLRPLVPETDAPPLSPRLENRRTHEWALVLRARRIPHRLGRAPDGAQSLLVPPRAVRSGLGEIRQYIAENHHPEEPAEWIMAPPVGLSVLAPLMALLAFFVFVQNPAPDLGFYPELWEWRGAAVAGDILSGQIYRAATALTLHGDPAHVLGNAAVGAVFAVCVCRELGTGTGWLAIILSGIIGNLLNAVYQPPSHISVGFSTAVFGAAGILAGYRLGYGAILTFRFKLAPVAAGLGLVAMLGAGGSQDNVDYGSHLFGFFAGIALGLLIGLSYRKRGLPSRAFDRAAYILAWSLPVMAWLAAWRV